MAAPAPAEEPDEEGVEDDVDHAADHRHHGAELWPFGSHVERLEGHLQHEARQAYHADAAVDHTLVHHALVGAQPAGYGGGEQRKQDGQHEA